MTRRRTYAYTPEARAMSQAGHTPEIRIGDRVSYDVRGRCEAGKVIGTEDFDPRSRMNGDFLIVRRDGEVPHEIDHVRREAAIHLQLNPLARMG